MTDWTSIGIAGIGVVGTLGGIFLGGLLQSRRERDARQDEREALGSAEAIGFERETIRVVIEKLTDFVKRSNDISARRLEEWRNSGSLPSIKAVARNEEYVQSRYDTIPAIELLLRTDLVDLCWKVVLQADAIKEATDGEDAERWGFDLSKKMSDAMKALGERHRKLYPQG